MPEIITQDKTAQQIKPGRFSNVKLSKENIKKRALALVKESSTWESTWKDIATYEYPTKGFFGTPAPNQGSKIDHNTLIDEEATLDIDTFASGMTYGFTSPSRPWFRLYIEDEQLMDLESVKYWLQEVQDVLYSIFQRSNTYPVLNEMYIELAAFGTACCLVEEDYDNGIHIRNFTIGEYHLGRDSKGRLNAFYHKFWMKVDQMVKDFGLENCSAIVQEKYKANKVDDWIAVNHLIEENTDRSPRMVDAANMAYRSVYWEDSEQNENSYLRISGYREFPVIAPRWQTTTNADAYGKGPGWKALGSVKELQEKVADQLILIKRESDPPVQADSTAKVNTLPGGVSRTSASHANAGVKPVFPPNQHAIAALDASIEKTHAKIKKFFFADLFLMMIEADRSGTPITATEIAERQSERVSKIAPLLEMWQGDEFIKALMDRTFSILLDLGVLPDPPPELEGQDIKIQYISVLAQAQRMIEIAAIDQWVNGVVADAGVDPEALYIINFDEKNRHKAEAMGIPPKIVNSIQKILEKRTAKAKALAQAQAQEQAMMLAQGAGVAAKAAKDAAAAKLGEGSILDTTVESMKGAQQ